VFVLRGPDREVESQTKEDVAERLRRVTWRKGICGNSLDDIWEKIKRMDGWV